MIVLLGSANYADVCPECKMQHLGGAKTERHQGYPRTCQRCGATLHKDCRRKLSEWEQFHSSFVCGECAENKKKGIILVAVDEHPGQTKKDVPIQGYFVITEEAYRRIFGPDALGIPDDMFQFGLKERFLYLETAICRKIGLFDQANDQQPPTPGTLDAPDPVPETPPSDDGQHTERKES